MGIDDSQAITIIDVGSSSIYSIISIYASFWTKEADWSYIIKSIMLDVATNVDTKTKGTTTKGTNVAEGVLGLVVSCIYLLECLWWLLPDPLSWGNIYLTCVALTKAIIGWVIDTIVDGTAHLYTILCDLDDVSIYGNTRVYVIAY